MPHDKRPDLQENDSTDVVLVGKDGEPLAGLCYVDIPVTVRVQP